MMTAAETVDRYLTRVASMRRDELIREILTFHCTFPLDLTPDYLDRQSTEQLRHILAAASSHVLKA